MYDNYRNSNVEMYALQHLHRRVRTQRVPQVRRNQRNVKQILHSRLHRWPEHMALRRLTSTRRPTIRPTYRPTRRPTARPTLRPTPRHTRLHTPRPTRRPTPQSTRFYDNPPLNKLSGINACPVRVIFFLKSGFYSICYMSLQNFFTY